ncbi:MAG: chain-length determining protein, partial [Bacteroidales bacterium]|nr:chain-length determining protein [Bacteroidales bacterium]
NQVYTQMVQQREMAKAKIQEAKPVYAVVQPATMPQFPMNSRKSRVLVFGFLGFFLACAWVAFGEDFLEKIKSQVKQETEE